jgi:hypothetical protein
MPYSYRLTNGTPDERQIALVRREVDDRTEVFPPYPGKDYFQHDADILAALESAREEAPSDANDVEVRLMACAAILDTLATNQVYIQKKQRTLADETDGPAVGKEIRAHAANLRARVRDSIQSRCALAENEAAAGRKMVKPVPGGVSIRTVF